MDRYRGPSRRSPIPRDRPIRERDDHPDVEYFGEGESYRPGGQTGEGPYRPPNRERISADTWSADRRDGRREERRDERRDDRREDIDSYIPTSTPRGGRPRSRSPVGFRRRSRTPPSRDRGDLFPNRARSPPRRYSPRRDDRPRSPPRRRSRSPYGRPRSPPPDGKRSRDFSPDGRRSPKRERLHSPDGGRYERPRSPPRRPYSPPRGGYRPRSRTPPRKTPYTDDNWRRRSPSPRPTGQASTATSRRSSPPAHHDRSAADSVPRSPAYPRNQYESRGDSENYRDRSPPRRDDTATSSSQNRQNGESVQPPTGPGGFRNGSYDRQPPSGPSRSYSQVSQHSNSPPPPSGPMSMSRGGSTSLLSAPTRPRGALTNRYEAPQRDFSTPAYRGRGSLTYRATTSRSVSYHQPDGPPAGPRATSYTRGDYGSTRGDFSNRGDYGSSRGDYSSSRGDYGSSRGDYGTGRGTFGTSRGDYGSSRGDYDGYRAGAGRGDTTFPFRQNNSSSTTYPRTQRFNTVQQNLSTVEKVVPGGKLLPSGLPPDQEKKIKTLEAEAEKIRAEIMEKQKAKREVLSEWEVREREIERDRLRSELAEVHLQKLTEGEDGVGRAAF